MSSRRSTRYPTSKSQRPVPLLMVEASGTAPESESSILYASTTSAIPIYQLRVYNHQHIPNHHKHRANYHQHILL